MEREFVVGAGTFAVFHFGLGYCSLEVHIPHGWSFLTVGLAARQVAQERFLADAP